MGVMDCGLKLLEIMGVPKHGQQLGHPGKEMNHSQRVFDYEQSTQDQAVPGPQGANLISK